MDEIKFLFFSTFKKKMGCESRLVTFKQELSVEKIFKDFFENPDEAQVYLRSVRFAINGEYVSSHSIVKAGDEVAVIPPVSGG